MYVARGCFNTIVRILKQPELDVASSDIQIYKAKQHPLFTKTKTWTRKKCDGQNVSLHLIM